MDKAIDIRRQAQRSIQNGDLDGALAAYERLIAADDSDPYNFILMADLLFKKGHQESAAKRYITAIDCYEKSALYKNAIAVGKKMMRLGLSPSGVLERLGKLHALDGLGSEATQYYSQAAEMLVSENKLTEATTVLRSAYDAFPENIKALERMAEVLAGANDAAGASHAFAEAAFYFQQAGRAGDAERCRTRAEETQPGAVAQFDSQAPPPPQPRDDASLAAPPVAGENPDSAIPVAGATPPPAHVRSAPEPGSIDLSSGAASPPAASAAAPPPPQRLEVEPTSMQAAPPAVAQPVPQPAPPVAAQPVPPAAAQPAPPAAPPTAPKAAGDDMPTDLKGVERLLASAQKEFRAGNRERAAEILAKAAQAFESFGRLDNAASIYRSLCNGPHATKQTLELWLRNCERREDRREAGTVACELGDRAIQENKLELAREWFERARAYDSNNLVARRRLDRLQPGAESAPVAPKPEPPAPAPPPAAPPVDEGKVQIGADRGQAVSFDFDATLAEFQKGVESQLSGDAQGHYDLAMAYREMGLTQQAIESFRFAASDPTFMSRAAEMIGHCLLEEGRIEDAARELTEALADPELDALASVGIRFQLGLALEAAGELQDALHQFEQVFAVQASHRDVAQKIRVLRKDLDEAA